jgi:hypothetical protein
MNVRHFYIQLFLFPNKDFETLYGWIIDKQYLKLNRIVFSLKTNLCPLSDLSVFYYHRTLCYFLYIQSVYVI